MPVFKLIMDLGLLLKMNSNQKWKISIDQNKCFLFSKKYILFSLLSFAKAICQQCFLTAYSRVTTIYIEPNQCPSHQSILLTQGPIHEISVEIAQLLAKLFFWVGHFDFFFCFIPMKISHKLCVRMDGTQFLILWWFTAKNECGNDIIAWV